MNHVDVSLPPKIVPELYALPHPLVSTILSSQELETLTAAVDRIIPPDNEGPGGAEGGSFVYIVQHLEEGGNLVPFRAAYHRFLEALAADGFVSLSSSEQDAFFTRIEHAGTETSRFFRVCAEHAQEGYYINPENWAGIGFVVTG
jgi:hypothetical protein